MVDTKSWRTLGVEDEQAHQPHGKSSLELMHLQLMKKILTS